MYPNRELVQLAARKSAQRRAISGQRHELVTALEVVNKPLRWIDRWRANLRRIAPFAVLAVAVSGYLGRRVFAIPHRRTGRLQRWARLLRYSVRGIGILLAVRRGIARQ